MSDVVTLKIDGRDVGGRDDQSVLEVARENHIFIPTLCNLEGLSPVGSCRLCLVEVMGTNKLLPACMTYVREGMEVFTNTEALQEHRRILLEMIFSESNHVCSVCVVNGKCELQTLAQTLGMDYVGLPYLDPLRVVDASHRRFILDTNRCILCRRCVRVCAEIEGMHTWDVRNRGIKSELVSDMFDPWGNSPSCTSCGKCVAVCPTGALSEKGSNDFATNQNRDFLTHRNQNRD